MHLLGLSRIAGEPVAPSGHCFRAVDSSADAYLAPEFHSATPEQARQACEVAAGAAGAFADTPALRRAEFLRALADRLSDSEKELVERADLETTLGADCLRRELAHAAHQLTLFAEELEDGSWLDARVEIADPERRTGPRPDHRSMRVPLGPVAVFASAAYPFAHSVLGSDVAGALAAGCPVVVKAHPAHPGTAALLAGIVSHELAVARLPAGAFSLLFDDGNGAGHELVTHPAMRGVAFCGTRKGGRAIMDLAAARAAPIPVYAEMGAANPVFLLPGALRFRAQALAEELHAAFNHRAGQAASRPGLFFVTAGEDADDFLDLLTKAVRATPAAPLMSRPAHDNYLALIGARAQDSELRVLAAGPRQGAGPWMVAPAVFLVDAPVFRARPDLADEVSGPSVLVVQCVDKEDMLESARAIPGAITAGVYAEALESGFASKLLRVLRERAGRVVYNGHAEGLEASRAIVHGGPYPATSDGRESCTGATSMLRFTRRVCFQNYPDAMLPEELRDENPLGIPRLVDGLYSLSPVERKR